jgi:hypothetical protein
MHRAEARHLETDTRPWYVWLRENEGTELDIVALEECPNRAKAHKAEAEAIKQLRRAGAVLFNEGIPTEAEGNKHSKRTRRKMSVAQRLAA